MDATISTRDMKRALAGLPFARRGPLPYLAMLRVEARPDGLSLSASDGETWGVINMDPREGGCIFKAEGVAFAPPDKLRALLRGAGRDGTVRVSTNPDNAYMTRVTVGGATVALPSIEAADYPDPPRAPTAAPDAQISGASLFGAVERVSYAVAHEVTWYALNGVLFRGANVVASDGKRLAMTRVGMELAGPEGIILPAAALACAGKLADDRGADVRFYRPCAAGPDAWFVGPGWTLATRPMDGTFPDYTTVIPTDQATALSVDRLELLTAILKILAGTEEKGPALVLTARLSADRLSLHATYADASCGILESQGKALRVVLNPKFVVATLSRMTANIVRFAGSGANSAVMFVEPGTLHLIMPLTVEVDGVSAPESVAVEALPAPAPADEPAPKPKPARIRKPKLAEVA